MANRPIQKPTTRTALLAILAGAFFLATAWSQSLGDLARQQRARMAQEKKAVKTYTNADIPGVLPPLPPPPKPATPENAPAGENAASPGGEKPAAEGAAPAKDETKKEEAAPAEDADQKQAALEKQYRDKFAKLRDQVAYEQEKLDVEQRELNLSQTQYYSDPDVAMREQHFRTDINTKTAAVEQQKIAVQKAQQAITDLEEELRKNGLPSGWAR